MILNLLYYKTIILFAVRFTLLLLVSVINIMMGWVRAGDPVLSEDERRTDEPDLFKSIIFHQVVTKIFCIIYQRCVKATVRYCYFQIMIIETG